MRRCRKCKRNKPNGNFLSIKDFGVYTVNCRKCLDDVILRKKKMKPVQSIYEQLMSKTVVTRGCWKWKGCLHKQGYGVLGNYSSRHYIEEKTTLAHRISYMLFVGPIPKGMVLDHLCRNTSCVNPAHLEVVTMRENIRRGLAPTAKYIKEIKNERD